jgi:sugar fermentation stimulation protein
MDAIYSFSKTYKALILSRPSKICKSPYLADIKVFDEYENIIEENVMAHSPALGCCGLISTNVYVICTKSESTKNKSKYVIHHILDKDKIRIGVNPMLANPIVKSLLLNNKIDEFQNITMLKSEVTIDKSRFDFSFINSNKQKVYLEVKNVPLVNIDDLTQKISIFPDGYRKNKEHTVSERALKHINHLTSIHKEDPNIICALIFLIQRNDVVSFKPSPLDKIYEKALYDAFESGVIILPICVEWKDNECFYLKKVDLLPKN